MEVCENVEEVAIKIVNREERRGSVDKSERTKRRCKVQRLDRKRTAEEEEESASISLESRSRKNRGKEGPTDESPSARCIGL